MTDVFIDWDWSATIQGVQEHMYTKESGRKQKQTEKNINWVSIVVATSRNMTWQVSREARFWLTSGQTAFIEAIASRQPAHIYTIDRQPAQHVNGWQRPRRVDSLWRLVPKRAWVEMLSTWIGQDWESTVVWRRATDTGHTHGHTDSSKIKSWGEVVRFCTSEKTARVTSPFSALTLVITYVPIKCGAHRIESR